MNRPWATDGSAPLYAILHWSRTADGVRWLLAHGADPDPVFAANGETPLHVVAARWDASLAEELVNRGADVNRRRADGRTPYAVAELSGNREVAGWLRAWACRARYPRSTSSLPPAVVVTVQRQRECCAARPHLRSEIGPEHYPALYNAAERNDLPALEAMLACGFDPNRPDESIGKTALHVAAMEGWPEAARLLLAHGARWLCAIASSTRRRSSGLPKDRGRHERAATMRRWAGCSWTRARRSSGTRARNPPKGLSTSSTPGGVSSSDATS